MRSVPRSFSCEKRSGIIKRMYYVYILKSLKDKSLYVGSTKDLRKRLEKHNSKSVTYSSAHAPFCIIWYSAFLTKEKAVNFEMYLKSSSGFAFRNKRLI